MKKIISLLIVLLLASIFVGINNVYAAGDAGIDQLITSMDGTSTAVAADDKVGGIINTIIGLLQVAGSGISLIVITILGIKYILASPGEKADVKKSAMPIAIGCVLLFGAVNLIAAIESFTTTGIFKNS